MVTKIKLDCKALQIVGKEFDLQHAEALLILEQEKGFTNWEISPDSGYTFSNGTIQRTNKGKNQKPGEPGGTQ